MEYPDILDKQLSSVDKAIKDLVYKFGYLCSTVCEYKSISYETVEKVRLLLCEHEGANPDGAAYRELAEKIVDLVKTTEQPSQESGK